MDEIRKNTLLIVDDSQDNLNVLSRILEREYCVIQALNGMEALSKAETSPQPDLILLDIMMPNMDGYEVIQILKENKDTKNIPVIVLSNLSHNEERTKSLALGAKMYLEKSATDLDKIGTIISEQIN